MVFQTIVAEKHGKIREFRAIFVSPQVFQKLLNSRNDLIDILSLTDECHT